MGRAGRAFLGQAPSRSSTRPRGCGKVGWGRPRKRGIPGVVFVKKWQVPKEFLISYYFSGLGSHAILWRLIECGQEMRFREKGGNSRNANQSSEVKMSP